MASGDEAAGEGPGGDGAPAPRAAGSGEGGGQAPGPGATPTPDDRLRGARFSGSAEVDGDQGAGRAFARLAAHGGAKQAAPGPGGAKPSTYRKPDDPDPYVGVGRNDPCPCGSGKKFKRCHGSARFSGPAEVDGDQGAGRASARLAAHGCVNIKDEDIELYGSVNIKEED